MTGDNPAAPTPFSRRLALADIPDLGVERRIEADEAERASLARLMKVPAIGRLSARLKVLPRGRRFDVTGEVEADLTVTCVVTLEPFETTMSEPVALSLSEDPESSGPGLDDDVPDPILGGVIDLGAIASEFLALGLDPHPRKPGVVFDAAKAGVAEDVSPFAALASLKKGS